MSDTEAIMWSVEKDPALRSDFCNLTLLDRRPDPDRLRATVQRALDVIPRLRQRVIGAPLRLVPPEFADDPTLEVDAHVRVVGVPAPGDDRALLDLCAALSEQPLDRARPLWEFTVVEGLTGGRTALLQKLHHTITDGTGGLRLSLALVDFERDPAPGSRPDLEPVPATPGDGSRRDTPVDVARQAVADAAARNVGAVKEAVRHAARTLANPRELPARALDAGRLLGSVRRQALVTDPARSDVLADRSLRRRFEVHRLPLAGARAAATSLGGSVNDVFVTGIAAALGRYHERFGSEVAELRVAMPVSTRERGDRETSNAFAPARVLVPIQPAHDVGTLFKDVHDRLEHTKHETALQAAGGFAALVSGLPTSLLVAFTRTQTRTVDFAASNLRGSPVPLYLAGARILANYPFGPRTASALNATTISYCDDLNVGFNIDPAAVTDVAGLLDDVSAAFDELLAYA
jgi:WS/DGAT/MGAT family acyltransferase